MPMINSKITVSLPQEKRDVLKSELGKAISILGKPESYLMLGFEDNYDLYLEVTNLLKVPSFLLSSLVEKIQKPAIK